MEYIKELGLRAKAAARKLAKAGTMEKDKALAAIADAIENSWEKIAKANALDIMQAKENGMTESLLDRLSLDEGRICAIADAVRDIIALPDPVGRIESGSVRPNGLKIQKVRVPMGVVGMIYEARPNVTPDAASLCLKSGNACILRGGKEAINSNMAMVEVIRQALENSGLPADCVILVEDTSRQIAADMMKANGLIDVLIPRGGAGLIASVIKNSTVPVIETGTGNCHVYADSPCDLQMAVSIVNNAKTSRPSVCNAAETLLVHKDIAEDLLPAVSKKLSEHNVQLRCCPRSAEILGGDVIPATEEDYATEFGDYIMAIRVVEDIDGAIEHISHYTTGHSEAIVTESYNNAQYFIDSIDAAAVYVNASTRFTDGGEFGFGAEIGISTQKLHARGPMGLEELTTAKYIVFGRGQIR